MLACSVAGRFCDRKMLERFVAGFFGGRNMLERPVGGYLDVRNMLGSRITGYFRRRDAVVGFVGLHFVVGFADAFTPESLSLRKFSGCIFYGRGK